MYVCDVQEACCEDQESDKTRYQQTEELSRSSHFLRTSKEPKLGYGLGWPAQDIDTKMTSSLSAKG